MKETIALLILLTSVGCSNADQAAISAWGKPHDIKCYSGGILIYSGRSSGKVENEENSDGLYFQDDKTKKLISITANCLVEVEP